MPVAVAVFDRAMRYIACSQLWLSEHRMAEADVVGRLHYDVFPDISDTWRAIHQRALAGETLSSRLDRYERADGSSDWVQWNIQPWHTGKGDIGGVVMFARVVTNEIEADHQKHLLGRELDMLIDGAVDYAIFMLDEAGRVSLWNRGAERLTGWCQADIAQSHYEKLFVQADIDAALPILQLRMAEIVNSYRGRHFIARRDSTVILADVILTPIRSEGRLTGFGVVLRDVTGEMEKAREAEAREAQLRAILDTVPDAMVVIDEDGSIRSFSATAEKMFGYTAQEVLGQNVAMLMPAPDSSRHSDFLRSYRETGIRRIMGQTRRVFGRRKDGTTFPHELTIGEAMGGGRRLFTGFLRDVTEREEAEEQLRQLQAELVRISRISAVGTMATALAHELNQPLTAIANYVLTSATLLADPGEDTIEIVREALEEAGQEAVRAGAIVQRLRAFVSRGELDRTIESPAILAAETLALSGLAGRRRHVSVEVAVPRTLGEVLVDKIQIQQVLLNLVRNAFEALEGQGQIRVGAREIAGGMLQFTIEDDGPGIDPEHQADLFEPFVSTKENGMGIGLAICRTIVESHGGKLWHEMRNDGGTAFHFTIPTIRGALEND